MSTVETIQRPARRRARGHAAALAAVCALVAVAVMALLIFALAGHSSTKSVRSAGGTQTAYAPLIQYRGTGQPPTTTATHRTLGAPTTLGLLRTEHSYGAVP